MSHSLLQKFKSTPTSRKIEILVAFLVLVVIIYFHVSIYHYAGGLWRDETNSAQLASQPLTSGIHNDLLYDSFPPASTVIFHFWTLISKSDQGFRLLGLLIGIGILVAFWFNSRILGLGIPLLSWSLFEFNPIALRFGDSIRPYGLGTFFILFVFGLVWKLAVSPKYSWKIFMLATLAAVLSVQVMYQNTFFLFAICLAGMVVAFLHKDRKKTLSVLSVGVIAALSLVPYIGFIKHASDWSSIAKLPYNPNAVWSVFNATLGISGPLFLLILVEVVVAGVMVFFYLPSKKNISANRKDLFIFSVITLLVGSMGYLLFLQRVRVPSETWYFIPILAIAGICLDSLFVVLFSNPLLQKNLKVFIVLIMLALTLQTNLQSVKIRTTNVDIIANHLSVSADKNDLILLNPWQMGVSFNRYYQGQTPWLTLPPVQDLSIHRYDLVKIKMSEANPTEPDFTAVQNTLRMGGRVWLIGSYAAAPDTDKEALDTNISSYMTKWSRDLGQFLEQHATNHQLVDLQINQEISFYENLPVTVFQGWRP